MSSKYNEEYYQKLVKQSNLPYEVIRAIVESQFEVVKETIKKFDKSNPETHKNIRLRHLGLLVAKKETRRK